MNALMDSSLFMFICLVVLVFIYFLPSLIAAVRNHPRFAPILAINSMLGWTVLGWVGAMVWSVSSIRK